MKIPKKETMKKYIKNNPGSCPKGTCPICDRRRAYQKALKGVK